MEDSITKELSKFKSLTAETLDKLRTISEEKVRKELGTQPRKSEYIQRAGVVPDAVLELESGWWEDIKRKAEPQDAAAAVIAVCLWIWSISHVLVFGLHLANKGAADLPAEYTGFVLAHDINTVITQGALILLSEVGVLYFFYRHILHLIKKEDDRSPLIVFSPNYMFAIFFAILTIVANVWAMVSGISNGIFWQAIGTVIGIVLPFVNMYLGERFSELLATVQNERHIRMKSLEDDRDSYYIRKAKMISKHDLDTRKYWTSIENPDQYHRDDNRNFTVYFAMNIIDHYKRYMKIPKEDGTKVVYNSWTPSLERALAAREIASSRMGGSLLEEIEAMTLLFTQGE